MATKLGAAAKFLFYRPPRATKVSREVCWLIMVELRRQNKADKRPARLERAGDLLILSMSFLVLLSIPLSAAHEITETHHPWEIVFANSAARRANQVSFHTVLKGYRSGVRDSIEAVARNQTEWSALWKRHASIEPNLAPPPAIDFSKEIVVAVFLGEKPTGGYDIAIVSAERSDGTLLISFVEKNPRPGAMVTQAFTQPFHIVRVAINGTGAVGFRRAS